MNLTLYGFYKIKDSYFQEFPSNRHMHNKHESRPYYLAVKSADGVMWMIPISHQVGKYKAKIAADEKKFKSCITCHIIRFMQEERAVLIGNMIPVTEDYIRGAFTISSQPYVLKNKADIQAIKKKASRYLSLVRAGKLRPYVDILAIEKQLKEQIISSREP